jgi:O-antigen/teichoic acid export membrane protein
MPEVLNDIPINATPGRIVRNTVSNTLSFAFLFASNLFLLPFIVHRLGDLYYGNIWVILGALTAYMGLIDLGTGMAFVKFISEYHAKGDKTSLLEVVNTGIAFYVVIGVVLLSFTWVAGSTILGLVGVPPAIMDDAVFVLRVGMLVFVIANVVSPMTSVMIGIQRMDINAYIAIATQTVSIAGTVFVLLSGYGVRGLIINNLVIVLLNAAGLTWFAFRLVPALRVGLRYCKLSMTRRFLGYGANLQVSKLAQIVLFQTDRILCLRLFGGTTATYYDIGARLNSTGRSFATLSVSALVPAVAELDALQHVGKIMTLYKRGSKYIAVVASYLFLFLGVFAPEIIRVWFWDERFLASVLVVRVLAFGYFFNIITGVASSLAAGLGKTEYDRRYGIFTSIFNLAATIGLALALGPVGIALGTTLSLSLGAAYYLFLFHGYIKVSLGEVIRIFGRPVLTGILASAIAWCGAALVPLHDASRLQQGGLLVVIFLVYSGLFAGILALLRVFDSYDLQLIRSITGKTA